MSSIKNFLQVIHAARTLSAHPVSKIAQENMEVFVDVWEAQVDELGKVLRLITAGGDPSKSKSDNCVAIAKVEIDFRDDKMICLWINGHRVPKTSCCL